LKSAISVPQKHATVLFFPDDLHPEAQWAPAYPSFAPNRYGIQIDIRPNGLLNDRENPAGAPLCVGYVPDGKVFSLISMPSLVTLRRQCSAFVRMSHRQFAVVRLFGELKTARASKDQDGRDRRIDGGACNIFAWNIQEID